MNPRPGGRKWIKLWVDPWLDGTTRFEMSDVQRAFWVDLLAMAGRSRHAGIICAGEVDGALIGYPLNKFEGLMSSQIDVLSTLKLFESSKKIRLTLTTEAPMALYMVEILNWDKYQSEYQRQKPYRLNKMRGGLQKSDTKSYNGSYSKGDTLEVEVEGEGEEKTKHLDFDSTVPGTPTQNLKSSLLSDSNSKPKSTPTTNPERQLRDAQKILRDDPKHPGARRAADEAIHEIHTRESIRNGVRALAAKKAL